MTEQQWSIFSADSQTIWNENAGFWDDYMGEGNRYYRELVLPAVSTLLALQQGDHILEIACGNGNFARTCAEQGATVLATDFSAVFLERAQARSQAYGERIQYQLLDATHSEHLLSLGQKQFDAVVCNMAIMDIPTITPLAQALPHLLKTSGRFVFTTQHPCFRTNKAQQILEVEELEDDVVVHRSLKVTNYLTPETYKGLGVLGQPQPQHYFHRPLHSLLAPFFQAGLAMDGLLEPLFDGGKNAGSSELSFAHYTEIPVILAARFRPIEAL